jgi:hypothetical protein
VTSTARHDKDIMWLVEAPMATSELLYRMNSTA